MKLTRWMADYYLCGWGQVLHAVVPAGVRDRAGTRIAAFVEPLSKDELPNPLPTVTPQQNLALDKLKREGHALEIYRLARLAKCGAGVVHGLVKKGLVRKFSERVESEASGGREPSVSTDQGADFPRSPNITLNPEQERVWARVRDALTGGTYKPFLLHGITGSGKTEIYLKAIEEIVKQGKEAIVLVPEISLTPQTISRFEGRCGTVAVMHSHLTNAERGGYWRRVASGHVQVVVGARSAVFAPTRASSGSSSSTRSTSTPSSRNRRRGYHARDVAVMRARLEGIPILMAPRRAESRKLVQRREGELHAPKPAQSRRGSAAAASEDRGPAARAEAKWQALRDRPDARSRDEEDAEGEGADHPAPEPARFSARTCIARRAATWRSAPNCDLALNVPTAPSRR